jgi:hypothetical protein
MGDELKPGFYHQAQAERLMPITELAGGPARGGPGLETEVRVDGIL